MSKNGLTIDEMERIASGEKPTPEQIARMVVMPMPTRTLRLLGYIQKWQAMLRIRDWNITLAQEEPDRANLGDVHMKPAEMAASIAIESRIPLEHEETVVLHECLEVFLDEWDTLVRELIDLNVAEGLKAAYNKRREDINHRVIYRLEAALRPDALVRPFSVVKCRE